MKVVKVYTNAFHDQSHTLYNVRLTRSKSTFTMAPIKCQSPFDNALDPKDPLSQAVPRAVINKVNRELKKAEAIMKSNRSAQLPFLRWLF